MSSLADDNVLIDGHRIACARTGNGEGCILVVLLLSTRDKSIILVR